VAVDDEGLLWLAPACDDWEPIVREHGLNAVIDLEAGLDAGIPAHPNRVIYVYFPFRDEDVPTLHKLHAVARLGAALIQARERVLVHCQMGLNRSALVAGLVLVYTGLSGEAAVARLQNRRPGALYNEAFASYLREQPAGGGS
jgi:protein-tyrosine phosphatase